MRGGEGMDRRRAHRKAVRHRNIRVVVVLLLAALVVLAAVQLRAHWSVPGAWAAVLLGGVAVTAALIVLGVVVGCRVLRSVEPEGPRWAVAVSTNMQPVPGQEDKVLAQSQDGDRTHYLIAMSPLTRRKALVVRVRRLIHRQRRRTS